MSHGWLVNGEKRMIIKTKDFCPLSLRLDKLNKLKFRSWNYHLLYTPTHVIQFILADLTLACSSTVIVFEKDKVDETLLRIEESSCPTFNKDYFKPEG
jgi:hypothetical protein